MSTKATPILMTTMDTSVYISCPCSFSTFRRTEQCMYQPNHEDFARLYGVSLCSNIKKVYSAVEILFVFSLPISEGYTITKKWRSVCVVRLNAIWAFPVLALLICFPAATSSFASSSRILHRNAYALFICFPIPCSKAPGFLLGNGSQRSRRAKGSRSIQSQRNVCFR